MMSNRAAAVAVTVAFIVGIVGSLAIRPPSATIEPVADRNGDTATEEPSGHRIHWRLTISNPTSLPVIGENPIYVAETLNNITGGGIRLDISEPGEIVPSFGITDAVRDSKVTAGYTWLGYDQGKIPASALLGAVPFGMEPWEYSAWWFEAGGRELGEALYHEHNVHPVYCGMTGPETAGWFREPINELSDVEGLKIRFAGLGGKVIERLGASVTMLPSGELFQALEKGAIDATEFALPIVDEALGFHRIAKLNYFPGWHQPFTASHLVVSLDTWNELAAVDQHLINTTCTAAVTRNLAKSEAVQGAVIAGFPDLGVSAQRLPLPLLQELDRVAQVMLDEEAARDDDFARILASQRAFEAEYLHWKRLAYLPRDFRDLP